MNKLKYILGLFAAVTFQSCTDFVDPAIPYSNFDTGVYLRTISSTPNIDFAQLATASWTLVGEAVDEENGNLVQQVEVLVRRRRGASLSPEVSLTTVPKSAFAPNSESKYLRATIQVTIASALAAMGFTEDDIDGGDFFEFRLILTDTQGRLFTNTNLSGDVISGGFYLSPFFYRVPVVCISDLAGTFNYSQTDMQSIYGSCPGTINGTVTFTATAAGTSYTVSNATFGFWECYGDTYGGNVTLNDACGQLSFSGTDKYGDAYTFTFISNNGTNLVFRWTNASAETGVVTLVANAGKPWPPNLQ